LFANDSRGTKHATKLKQSLTGKASMRTATPTKKLFALMITAGVASGCASHSSQPDESIALAQDGTDVNDVESQSSALTASFTLACGDFTDPAASVTAASGVGSFFTPQSCISATQDVANSTVTYTLGQNGVPCSGPWGLAGITGTVTVVYSKADNGVRLDVTGTGLQLNARRMNHASADLTASATLTANAGAREMIWKATLKGNTARGNPFTRTASWDVQWRVGESCISLTGAADGNVNNRSLETTVSDYQRCLGECPAAGGKITIKNDSDGEEISLEYNGGNDATFTDVNNKSMQIELACGL
jgi:hypothetical protein